jgi:hypothetical protein
MDDEFDRYERVLGVICADENADESVKRRLELHAEPSATRCSGSIFSF